jgi:hypothetical protein
MYFGHGMYSQTLRAEIADACGDWSHLSPKCIAALEEMNSQIGKFDIYNIYDECGTDQRRRLDDVSSPKTLNEIKNIMSKDTFVVESKDSFRTSGAYSQALNDYTCGAEAAMDSWLSEPSVAAALHVKLGTPGMTYKKTAGDLLPLYSELISKYQMLIYSGDTDGCVPYVSNLLFYLFI